MMLTRSVRGVLTICELREPLPTPLSKLNERAADDAYRLGLVRLVRGSEEPQLQLTRAGFAAIDHVRDTR